MKWIQDDVPWVERVFVDSSKNRILARVSPSAHEGWWWQIYGHPELEGRELHRSHAEQKAVESLMMLGAIPYRE